MKSFSALFATALCMLPATAQAADIAAGKELAAAQCRTCHGLDGIATIPIAPHLAGESEIYLQTQLKAFRSGEREHEMMTMSPRNSPTRRSWTCRPGTRRSR